MVGGDKSSLGMMFQLEFFSGIKLGNASTLETEAVSLFFRKQEMKARLVSNRD